MKKEKKSKRHQVKYWKDGTITLPNGSRLPIKKVSRMPGKSFRLSVGCYVGDDIKEFPLSVKQTEDFCRSSEPIMEKLVKKTFALTDLTKGPINRDKQ